jgi:hypothetical protein
MRAAQVRERLDRSQGHHRRSFVTQDLGLHRSLTTLKLTVLERELRKRIFWYFPSRRV